MGEASSISLALESENDCLLLIDDLRARKFAKSLGLQVLGTLGLIAKAQKEGKIESGIILIEKIQETNFRLSSSIINEIKKLLR